MTKTREDVDRGWSSSAAEILVFVRFCSFVWLSSSSITAAAFSVQRAATGVADIAAIVSPSIAGHRSAGYYNSSARVVRWRRRRKKCRRVSLFSSFSYYVLSSVYYHGVNGESLGGDAPRRRRRCRRRRCRCHRHRDLGDSGEFRNRLRSGSGREHRRLDETAGGFVSLLYTRHEGSDGSRGRHGIICLCLFCLCNRKLRRWRCCVRDSIASKPRPPPRDVPGRVVASCRLFLA